MSRATLVIISLLLIFSVSAETVYKKTNPDGSVEFTDRDIKGSKEIQVHDPITYTAPKLPALGLPVKKLSPNGDLYSVDITSPANDSTILDSPNVTVAVSLVPALSTAAGHQIRYQLGRQSITSQQTSVTFKNVYRGTHNINVSVVNSAGEALSSVTTSIFYMKRFFKKPTPKPKVP